MQVPYEGAGMNPARALGPAVVSDYFELVDKAVAKHAVSIRRTLPVLYYLYCFVGGAAQLVERQSLTGELSLSCARPAADG